MQNTVTTYNNPWIDLSTFGLKANQKEYKFYSSTFDSYIQCVNQQNDPEYGLYGFTVNKNQLSRVTTFKIYTFDSYLALVGGYAGIITFLIALVMDGYQEFAYERSLVRILYKRKRKGDVHDGSEVHNPRD